MATDPDAVAVVNFPATHWSLVSRAGVHDADTRRRALEELLVRYLPALRAHLVWTKRLQPADADDLLQEFVAGKVLAKDLLGQANPQLGKFRTFLLTALDRFWLNRLRDQQAKKRSPHSGPLVTIGEHAEELAGTAAGSDAFDVVWARGVIAESLRRMQDECQQTGRGDVWGVFESRVVTPALQDVAPIEYAELISRFHLTSPSQAANLLVTAKRMYTRALRSVVAEYALDENEIEVEVAELREILAYHDTRE